MENDLNPNPVDPEQLLEIMRTVAASDAWDTQNWALHQAFVRGLEEWAQAKLFPAVAPRYFVAGLSSSMRLQQPCVVNSLDRWNTGHGRTAPVPEQTLLLATEHDQVSLDPVVGQGDVLNLSIPLAVPFADQLAQLPTIHPEELDLYCDANNRQTLGAFHRLLGSRWPRDIGLPSNSREVWPRIGLRPVWRLRGPPLSPGPVDLLNLTHHPLQDRFARLPLSSLAAYAKDSPRPALVVPIQVGADAREVAARLDGHLFVNHVPFWNYHIGLVDCPKYVDVLQRSDAAFNDVVVPLDDAPGTSPYLVIECWSRSPHVAFVERRWSSWVDPFLCFETPRTIGSESEYQSAEDVRELRLRFAPGKVGQNLVVVYVVAEDWSVNAIQRDDVVTTSLPERELLRVRDMIGFVDEGAQTRAFEEMQLATWLAAGRRSFPDAPIVTRDELARAVWRWLPDSLRRRVRGHQSTTPLPLDWIRIWTALQDQQGRSYPITVVELLLRGKAEDLSYYLEWLSRTLEARCPFGTSLEVRMTTDGSGDA